MVIYLQTNRHVLGVHDHNFVTAWVHAQNMFRPLEYEEFCFM